VSITQYSSAYEVLDHHLGERFESATVEALLGLKPSALEGVHDDLQAMRSGPRRSDKAATRLCPLVGDKGWTEYFYLGGQPISFPSGRVVRQLLLYSHQVAIHNPLRTAILRRLGKVGPAAHGLDELGYVLGELAYARPFVDSDVLVLVESERHEILSPDAQRIARLDMLPQLHQDVWPSYSVTEQHEFANVSMGWDEEPDNLALVNFESIAVATYRSLDIALGVPGVDLWLPLRLQLPIAARILQSLSGESAAIASRQQISATATTSIATIQVPSIDRLAMSDLVAIRKNEEIFEEWRTTLAEALAEAERVGGPSDAANMAVLQEFLTAARSRLDASARRKRVDYIRPTFRDFAIGTCGAVAASAAFGGGVAPSLVAASTTATVAAAASAVGSLRSKRAWSALRNHYSVVLDDN
jgi:hypothetical protein